MSGAGAGSRDPERPLAGRRVLVTRSYGQSAGLTERLQARGAEVVLVPMVGFAAPDDPRPLQDALRSLGDGDWLLLTSANAVRAVAGAASSGGAALPPALRLASSGPATTEAIRSLRPGRPITAEATGEYGSEGLARAFALVNVAGARMVFPVSDRSPAELAGTLRARGARVEVVVAYRTIPPDGSAQRLREALEGGLDAMTFASPSAVEAFTALGGIGSDLPVIVMGPTTASAARSAGLTVAAIAESATGAGLAEAVERHLAGTPGNR